MNNLDFMIKRSDQCTPKLNSAQIPSNTKFHYSSLDKKGGSANKRELPYVLS